MALRQLALNLQQEISTGGDFHNVKERLDGLSSGELQELCSFRVDGRTLLATIAATNKWDLLDYLINQGVKVHQVDETILHFAVVQKSEKIVKLLTKNGIDVNHARDDGKTPLHVASEYGHTEIVKFLLENGAHKSMDMTERSGCTPLTLSAMTGQTPVMSELIKHGANINVTSGFPPLHAAALLGHSKIIHLLLENNADVNLWDAAKALAIHYAAMKNHKHVVEELISRGSNLRTKDSRGNLPLNLAKSNEVKQIIRQAMGLDTDEPLVRSPGSPNNTNSPTKSPVSLGNASIMRNSARDSSEPETGEVDHFRENKRIERKKDTDENTSDCTPEYNKVKKRLSLEENGGIDEIEEDKITYTEAEPKETNQIEVTAIQADEDINSHMDKNDTDVDAGATEIHEASEATAEEEQEEQNIVNKYNGDKAKSTKKSKEKAKKEKSKKEKKKESKKKVKGKVNTSEISTEQEPKERSRKKTKKKNDSCTLF